MVGNTVDALKNLYKTLCGSDYAGNPNPTDAEMIDAIAKDATSGGGESEGGWEPRFIDYSSLPDATDFPSQWAKQYEVGLEPSDFYGAFIKGNAVFGVGSLKGSGVGRYFKIGFLEFSNLDPPRNGVYTYYPELGVIDGPEFAD